MNSERQESWNWEEVREDHRQRYVWADERLPRRRLVQSEDPAAGLEAFYGSGYGTAYLTRNHGRYIYGFDGAYEAFAAATDNHPKANAVFVLASWPERIKDLLMQRSYFKNDFAVCIESVEHVEDGVELLRALTADLFLGGSLVFSTPNNDLLPKLPLSFPHHVRHYSLVEAFDLVNDIGLDIVDWAGQDVYRLHENGYVAGLLDTPVVKSKTPGQFTLVHAVKPLGD